MEPKATAAVEATKKINFFNLTRLQLEAELMGSGKERFRATQLFQWVYKKGITDVGQMSNLSKEFRTQIQHKFDFHLPTVAKSVVSRDETRKLLVNVGEGKTVETVMIPSEDRMTLCVSSEIGCNMACQFCFTGKQKLQRRLEAFEIVAQFLRAKGELEAQNPQTHKLTNIVFMGMGEPLDNLPGVFDAISIICDDHGLNFSKKKITVSTSGLVPQIPEVSKAGVRLAVSLNASSDEMRDIIMPINKRYPLKELMKACHEYYLETKDRITFEYVILKGVNDTLEDARKVHQIVKGVPCKLNLIPFNEHEGSEFVRPEMSAVLKFQNELIRLGHSVFIRRTMGRDIYAACGQLRSKFENHPGWRKELAADAVLQ